MTPALRSYPLYPYLQAERIRQAFNDGVNAVAADRRAAGFLATFGLLPVGIQLRRSWLENLAQRSQWDAFLTVYREAATSDALRCQGTHGQDRNGADRAAGTIAGTAVADGARSSGMRPPLCLGH